MASKLRHIVFCVTLVNSIAWAKSPLPTEDQLALEIRSKILTNDFIGLEAFKPVKFECFNPEGCRSPSSIIYQELDEVLFLSRTKERAALLNLVSELYKAEESPVHRLSLLEVGLKYYPDHFKEAVAQELRRTISRENVNDESVLFFHTLKKYLPKNLTQEIESLDVSEMKNLEALKEASNVTRYELARDLLYENPPIDTYFSGKYAGKPRLYKFCRSDRQYPCLMLMRLPNGELYKTPDNRIWNHPSLGYSRHQKEFNEKNGNTPSGVWRIDGVMPEADQKLVYGKHRRLILNFVGASPDEENIKKLLPQSSHNTLWWREGVIARDLGRGLFRIHGTGLKSNKQNPFFPFVATSGCVAQRENMYDNIDFNDQRILLNDLMLTSDLIPIFENEPKITALLYVINIDSAQAPVTLKDLINNKILATN
jgi:hypothetical protein